MLHGRSHTDEQIFEPCLLEARKATIALFLCHELAAALAALTI